MLPPQVSCTGAHSHLPLVFVMAAKRDHNSWMPNTDGDSGAAVEERYNKDNIAIYSDASGLENGQAVAWLRMVVGLTVCLWAVGNIVIAEGKPVEKETRVWRRPELGRQNNVVLVGWIWFCHLWSATLHH